MTFFDYTYYSIRQRRNRDLNDAVAISNQVLIEAYTSLASDIHFYPSLDKADIYFRIHGKRVFIKTITKKVYDSLLAYFKFTSRMDIGEIRKPQNGTITHQHENESYSLRLSTLPLYLNESLAIRILPQGKVIGLNNLFLFPKQILVLKKWMQNKAGLILLTGATGSGKTTTLYALLEDVLKEKSYQAITLEDPIEKKIDHILQVQVNEKAGITYKLGLKAALRHDPDIIMVGEIRDKETAEFAFEAALTGHLVLSTLHAKDAVGTLHRLLEMGLKPIEIEQTLLAVASIELLPIIKKNNVNNRAAIMDLLEGNELINILRGGEEERISSHNSFDHLRKKAFAYGYISEEFYKKYQI